MNVRLRMYQVLLFKFGRHLCKGSINTCFGLPRGSLLLVDNYTILHCTALHCTVLYCTVLYCTVLYCTVLYCTVLYCTVLYCTVLYCTVLYCTVLYCTVQYSTVLYCTVLYCTVLYCTVLYCTVLYLEQVHPNPGQKEIGKIAVEMNSLTKTVRKPSLRLRFLLIRQGGVPVKQRAETYFMYSLLLAFVTLISDPRALRSFTVTLKQVEQKVNRTYKHRLHLCVFITPKEDSKFPCSR